MKQSLIAELVGWDYRSPSSTVTPDSVSTHEHTQIPKITILKIVACHHTTQAMAVKLCVGNAQIMSTLSPEQKVLYKTQAPRQNDQMDAHFEGMRMDS